MQQVLSEGKLVSLKIDFNKLHSNVLRESFLSQFGGVLKEILRRMFGRVPTPHELEKALSEQEGELGAEAVDQLQQAAQPNVTEEEETKPDHKLIINGTDEEVAAFLDTLI